jgi:hypothetical protein
MTQETFKALYEIQEAIGNFINIATKTQEASERLIPLMQIAKSIGDEIGTPDNHWFENPISLEDAWTNYIKY